MFRSPAAQASNRWIKRRATPYELAVIEAFALGGDDQRQGALMVRQVAEHEYVERRRRGAEFALTIPWTTQDVALDHRMDTVVSGILETPDLASGRLLRFHVKTSWMFQGLFGTCEGGWPKRWSTDLNHLRAQAQGLLSLAPRPTNGLAALESHLGAPAHPARSIMMFEAAAETDLTPLAACPQHQQVTSLLLVTNGLDMDGLAVLGTRDVYEVQLGLPEPWWLVGMGPDQEQYLLSTRGVGVLDSPLADGTQPHLLAPSYLDWIRSLVCQVGPT